MIDLKPSEMVTALVEGKIDAASCYHPLIPMRLRKTLEETPSHGLLRADRTTIFSWSLEMN